MEEEIKQECIKRLEILKLDSNVINEFKNNNKVYVSKINNSVAEVIFDDDIINLTKFIEQKKTLKIYHIITMDNKFYILCVHNHKDTWKKEKSELKRGFAEVISFKVVTVSELKDMIEKYKVEDIGIKMENEKMIKIIECKKGNRKYE